MGRHRYAILHHQGALKQVRCIRVIFEIGNKSAQGSRVQEHMGIETKHKLPVRFSEYQVPHCRASNVIASEVTCRGSSLCQFVQCGRIFTFRVIVDDQNLRSLKDFGMVQAQGRDSEIGAIKIIVGGHAECQQRLHQVVCH